MERRDQKDEQTVEVVELERRMRDGAELSSAEVMKILRQRAAKNTGKPRVMDAQWDEPAN